MRNNIQDELFKLKDEKYKDFSLKLLPGLPEESFLGVRIPLLRKLAKEVASEPYWEEYLKEEDDLFFEEKMLQAILIGLIKVSPREKLELIEDFLPKIDNWSVCDSFCNSLKFAREEKNQEMVWKYIEPLFYHKEEYQVRFASVMALNYFLKPEYLEGVLRLYDSVNHEGYYAKLAVSWGISAAFVKDPVKTMEFLKNNSLDDFTYNKAVQKLRDSFRLTLEEKELLKKLK